MAEKAVRVTKFEAGLVAAMLNDQARGGEWFGPGQPVPDAAPPDVKGRQFDYEVSRNIIYKPKGEATEVGLSFETIRLLTQPALGGLDLVRGAIETVKDKMSTQAWTVRAREGNGGSKAWAQKLEQALRSPDGVHTFRTWMRMFFEDPLSIDHNFVVKSKAPNWMKSPFGFMPENIDGATIKLLIDGDGRRPLPVEKAYQQILHGIPAASFTPKELLYFPYNPLPQRAYALGPVEQFVGIVNIALRRQTSVSQYYTEGNVPDALVGVPEDWKTAQIKEFQEYWDSVLAGDTGERRKAKFVPGGMTPHFTRDPKLKDEEDDYLARVLCWCYGLSPNALVKSQNRAVAQTQKNEAAEEGLEPRKGWFKDSMDGIIAEVYGAPELEFIYQDEEIQDPLIKAQVFQIALGGPTGAGKAWLTIAEVREKTGEPPMTPEQEQELKPEPVAPPQPLGPDGKPLPVPGGPGAPGKPGAPGAKPAGKPVPAPGKKPAAAGQKVTKLSKASGHTAKNDRPDFVKRTGKVALGVSRQLKKVAKAVIPGIVAAYAGLSKATEDNRAKKIATVLKAEDLQALNDYLKDQSLETYNAGVLAAADELAKRANDEMVNLANENAIDWAADHAGERIKDYLDATRNDIEDVVGEALEKGWSNDELAAALQDSWSFGKDRAELIATTETAFADVQGNVALYKEAGIEQLQVLLSDDDPCDECIAAAAEPLPVDAAELPPFHPRCECDVAPVIPEKED